MPDYLDDSNVYQPPVFGKVTKGISVLSYAFPPGRFRWLHSPTLVGKPPGEERFTILIGYCCAVFLNKSLLGSFDE